MRTGQPPRRGTVVPFVAMVMVVLLAMVAFAVDFGLMCWTEAELQNAADAAALAGAAQLMSPQVAGSTSQADGVADLVTQATAEAQRFGGYHRAGGVQLKLPAEDVVIGYQATPGKGTLTAWANGDPFPNSVQVTMRRSAAANGSLPLHFAPVLGIRNWDGSATAVASVRPANLGITGFRANPTGALPQLLPLAIDGTLWSDFLKAGKSPDGTVHDNFTATLPTSSHSPPNNVCGGGDGVPEFSDAYGNKTSPGNFGLINLRLTNPANDTPTFSNWVLNGPSEWDFQTFGSAGLQATPNAPLTLKGGPGLKSSLQPDLQSIVGQSRIVLLYSSYEGNGNNTTYKVTGFAGVTVVKANGKGTNLEVVLQPMTVINANATVKASTQTFSSFIYASSPLSLTR